MGVLQSGDAVELTALRRTVKTTCCGDGDALPGRADEFRADLGAVPPFDPAAPARSGVPRQLQTKTVGDIAGRIDHDPDARAGQFYEPAGSHRESVVETDPRLAADRR